MSREITGDDALTLMEFEAIVRACDRFEAAWREGRGPRIEEFLAGSPTQRRGALLRELVALEVELRRADGDCPTWPEYRDRFPEHTPLIGPIIEGPKTWPSGAGRTLPGEVLSIPHLQLCVNDRYEVVELVGRGGMGIVYRAYDRHRRDFVAIKTLRSFDPALLYRLKREFRSLSNVTHPNLVSLFELTSDGQTWFISMEFIDGTDLISYINGGHTRAAIEGESTRSWSLIGRSAPRVVGSARATALRPEAATGRRAGSSCASKADDREARLDRLRGAMVQLALGFRPCTPQASCTAISSLRTCSWPGETASCSSTSAWRRNWRGPGRITAPSSRPSARPLTWHPSRRPGWRSRRRGIGIPRCLDNFLPTARITTASFS